MQLKWKTLLMRLQFSSGRSVGNPPRDPTLSTSLISLNAMWKALRETGEGILAELGHIGVMEPSLEVSPSAPIQRILDQFQYVFQSPSGVPPRRTKDHVITLQSSRYTPC